VVLVPISYALYRLVEAPGMTLGRATVARLRPAASGA
jgi:peptidoglycan/LPS O-acetylase OafA/YrhL